ncbi:MULTISPECIES: hypothetical protein [unclassified Streptomyces]|uniref:hypothetical protein n=1 Tax=unclassified Streptomyces TaxID=2593676 RepID=UPI002DDBFF0F|nr:hypothetical protein [Streptomyces sp. NBC_01237]WRZ74253.1 hypothetical protein OG251_23025 [Streptomyces sp. NBC_01237]
MTGAGQDEHRISDGLSIMHALERTLGHRYSERTPQWADLGFPVIDRGAYAIFPLAVARVREDGDSGTAERLSEMTHSLRRNCVHFFGGDDFHAEMALDAEDGYGRKLADAGAVVTGPPWECVWCIQRFAVVLAHSVDRHRAWETLALHIVPVDWVRYRPLNSGTKREASRQRRIIRERDAADVVWSWPLPVPDE